MTLRACIAAVTVFAAACNAPQNLNASIDLESFPAQKLSDYRLFADAALQIPNPGVIPYDLNTPHFADYAQLHRFLWLPPGEKIQYKKDEPMQYPIGATLILTVAYRNDIKDPAQGERLIETRLFVLTGDGWDTFQYVWNEEMTEATLALSGARVDVSWRDHNGAQQDLRYYVPNRNQCKMCHQIDGDLQPLGPLFARNLNRDQQYGSQQQNQLAHWSGIGILEGLPEDPDDAPRWPIWDDPSTGDLNDRARAYLDMNCSGCHRPGGLAYTSGLDLRYTQNDPVRFGIFKAPIAAGRAAGKGRFGIVPGQPEDSILLHRMRSTDPGIRMPVVGRSLVHKEGVALIQAWIEQLEYPELAALQADAERFLVTRGHRESKKSE